MFKQVFSKYIYIYIMKYWQYILILISAIAVTKIWAKLKPSICLLPHSVDGYSEPVVWRCNGQLPLWSYSRARNECVQFRYGGCGGNDNNFYTKRDCELMCKD